jgi:hypothetical protein
MYYRGQSNYSWDLTPGIFRNQKYDSIERIIQEFDNHYPHESFDDNHHEISKFEKITKLQHYGFPSNFLDFTENAFFSLFFACAYKNDLDKDGSVFICNSFVFNNPTVINSIPAELWKSLKTLTEKKEIRLNHIQNMKKQKYREYINDGISGGEVSVRIHLPKFFSGGKVMNRPNKQKSIFLVFYANDQIYKSSSEIKEITKDNEYYFSSFYFKPAGSEQKLLNNSTVLKIDKNSKEAILKELDYLKINKVELFPEMDYFSSYMKGNLWL